MRFAERPGTDSAKRPIRRSPAAETATIADARWVAQTADHVLAVMEEAARPGRCGMSAVDLLIDEVLDRRSVALAAPRHGIDEPQTLRRTDGSSIYSVAGADLYTSRRILDTGRRLVAAAGRRDGPAVEESAVDLALLELAANGTAVDPGQASLVRQMCTSGARLQLAIAPAGAGKTTAMHALTLAGTQDGGQILGIARTRPQPLFLPNRPASAPAPSPNSPGLYSTASCPTGRPRSARRPW